MIDEFCFQLLLTYRESLAVSMAVFYSKHLKVSGPHSLEKQEPKCAYVSFFSSITYLCQLYGGLSIRLGTIFNDAVPGDRLWSLGKLTEERISTR